MVRTGRELWNWLNPRIRQLVFLQTQWGSVHDVYGTPKGSMFEEKPVPKWIRDPDSTLSGYWDLAQIFFLLYITWTVPLRVGLSMDVVDWGFWFFFEMARARPGRLSALRVLHSKYSLYESFIMGRAGRLTVRNGFRCGQVVDIYFWIDLVLNFRTGYCSHGR
jgi:hypothetical protein